jgi:hypothetical protein
MPFEEWPTPGQTLTARRHGYTMAVRWLCLQSRNLPTSSHGTHIVHSSVVTLCAGLPTQGFRMVDKELRNDILVVANLILGSDHDSGVTLPHASGPGHTMSASGAAASPSSLPQQSQQQPGGGTVATSIGSNTRSHNDCGTVFALAAYEAGLFDTLLAVSTTPEFGVSEHPGLVKAWALTTEELDYELKHLAWRCVVTACSATGPSGPVLPLATSWGLTRALLAFVEPNPEASASQVCVRTRVCSSHHLTTSPPKS